MNTRRHSLQIPLLLGLSLCVTQVNAWGTQGHRLAGRLAEEHLTEKTAAAVTKLLGSASIAEASFWADRMRDNPARFWQREAGPYHFLTVPPGAGAYRPDQAPSQGDAYTALGLFAGDIKSEKNSAEGRALALRFAIHIVQDLHQPLHVGGRADRGGNDFTVTYKGQRSNLHRVWDSDMLADIGFSDQRWLARLKSSYGSAMADAAKETAPETWIAESLALSRSIYPDGQVVGEAYLKRHRADLEARIALAGARTAAWLNALFDEDLTAAHEESRPSLWRRLTDFLEKVKERLM